MSFFNRLFGGFGKQQSPEATPAQETKPVVKTPKPRKQRRKPEPVAAAPAAEPEVKIVNFDFDKTNPKMGSLELDWNPEFVALLRSHGYPGRSDEDVVDAWLNDVCRNILSQAAEPTSFDSSKYVIRTDIGDGRSEIR
jgi:hypothetical protein